MYGDGSFQIADENDGMIHLSRRGLLGSPWRSRDSGCVAKRQIRNGIRQPLINRVALLYIEFALTIGASGLGEAGNSNSNANSSVYTPPAKPPWPGAGTSFTALHQLKERVS